VYTHHYLPLNALQSKYAGKPFAILGFPCGQFRNQEPGANATEILNSIKYVRPGKGFVPNFQMFAKTKVNGKDAAPMFTFLKSKCETTRKNFFDNLLYEPLNSFDIRWNWEKFLVDGDGIPIRRYNAKVDPMDIEVDIRRELDKLSSGSSCDKCNTYG